MNGELDIASNDPLVKILKNNGDGTFAPAIDYTPARNFADMKLRDINGDGFVDLIFAPTGTFLHIILYALNLGNGTFAPTLVTDVFSCGEGTIDAADLDGDGDLDIVLPKKKPVPESTAHIFIFRNDGNQNFVRMPDIVLPGLIAARPGSGGCNRRWQHRHHNCPARRYGRIFGQRKSNVWSPDH